MKKGKILGIIIEITVLISLVIAYAHYIEPKLLTYKEYPIEKETITDNFNGFKIIHISDLHYGRVLDKARMEKIVNSINDQKPDIVVLTGDLLDETANMTMELSEEISQELSKINVKIGKYAINGEHDLKFDEWSNIINNGGFININNNYDTIYKNGYSSLLIAGISSVEDKADINEKINKTIEFINSFEKDGPIYKILLMHEPDIVDKIEKDKFDLILAGHSHHGQFKIFDYPLVRKKNAKKYYKPHYKLNNTDLYISNGIGVSKYNYRLFNTPSYNIYRLVKK